MPHVVVKLYPGKSERQKQELADAIVEDVTRIFRYGEESVSVAMEEISPDAWPEKVYRGEILAHPGRQKTGLHHVMAKPNNHEVSEIIP